MAPEGDVAPADMPDDAPGSASGGLGAGGGGYVPPHLRGRAGAGEKMGGKFDRDDSATLRVTNVSEFAEEQDLRDMFSRYGHVTRVFLAKDRETGRAKGFAFVSYADRTDAAKACEKMDGCKSCTFLRCWELPLTISQSVSDILSCASSLRRRLSWWHVKDRKIYAYWRYVGNRLLPHMVVRLSSLYHVQRIQPRGLVMLLDRYARMTGRIIMNQSWSSVP
jgi:RNA recognition motif-containing protein